jgi:hypothetical protein
VLTIIHQRTSEIGSVTVQRKLYLAVDIHPELERQRSMWIEPPENNAAATGRDLAMGVFF